MAARAGEEVVAILHGDVHYLWAEPGGERFDRGSHLYLIEDAAEGRSRLQIVNRPGAEDEDAMQGYLTRAWVRYSYRQHCLVSMGVGGSGLAAEGDGWYLPVREGSGHGKALRGVRSIGIYFWTQDEALLFLNTLRPLLPPVQVEVQGEPGEATAMAKKGHSIARPQGGSWSGQGQQASTGAKASGDEGAASTLASRARFAPMAYNPAAPAAPEALGHREKTPPGDGEVLNPLAVAVVYDYQEQPPTPGMSAAAMPSPRPLEGEQAIQRQLYRPTEAELRAQAPQQGQAAAKGERRGRLEEGAGKVERGVTGILKRFEKRFG